MHTVLLCWIMNIWAFVKKTAKHLCHVTIVKRNPFKMFKMCSLTIIKHNFSHHDLEPAQSEKQTFVVFQQFLSNNLLSGS